MSSCKFCLMSFIGIDKSARANHTRWCEKNPKRDQWNKSVGSTNKFGCVKDFTVTCVTCLRDFIVKEREKLHPQKKTYFCSKSCANNRQSWWDEQDLTNYKTIAYRHWEKKCAICGFDKIVAIHHIDENHSNNDPHNLLPLCPNHHEMFHSRWRVEIEPLISEAISKRMGL